jgi:hypothetical protein
MMISIKKEGAPDDVSLAPTPTRQFEPLSKVLQASPCPETLAFSSNALISNALLSFNFQPSSFFAREKFSLDLCGETFV